MGKKILLVASEIAPLVKTGGLADVAGALPKELKKLGHDIRLIMPEYSQIPQHFKEKIEHVCYFYVNVGWRREYVGLNKIEIDGIIVYLVDSKKYFERESLYENSDKHIQFTLFSRAVLECLPKIEFKPDVIHCNDWQTGLIPMFLKENYKQYDFFSHIKTVYTIHNLQYQGQFGKDVLSDVLAIPTDFQPHIIGDHVNFMRLGIIYADKITTVSPTYAEEILSYHFGEGLDWLLNIRRGDVSGIVNGIDTDVFNPSLDKELFQNYSLDTFKDRVINKTALQEKLGLNVDATIPMIGMITRLADQKGLDLIEHVLYEVQHTDVQLVVLGSGDQHYVNMFEELANVRPRQVSISVKFDSELAKQIYAGSDFFLMPSRFEPCGLGQLLAMRYGAVPIVRETGGLKDTVFSYDDHTREGNGFSFSNYNAHDMLHTIERAIHYYRMYPDIIDLLRKRGMAKDYSWTESAKAYESLYNHI
ncbi:MAG: glycogen synthase GlgA [Fusobacteria bacterium]|nr:glycogen synthase GlgA [Fusobacteriota bacterium]